MTKNNDNTKDFAEIDLDREKRTGFPEVIFGETKTPKQSALIAEKIYKKSNLFLITRTNTETFNEVKNTNINYEIKECQTLETICASIGIRDIDVLKIDIEGSEYLLKNDILSLCPLYISMEFAPYLTNNSEYKNMLKILSEKYLIYSEGGGSIQNPKIIENIDMYIDDLIKKRQPVDILLKLKENKILTRDELADLSSFELIEILSELDNDKADKIIIDSRQHWFKD